MKIVWVVNEGSPGHLSQSLGFSRILNQIHPHQTIEVFGRTTLRGWQRHLLRYLMGKKGRSIPLRFLNWVADTHIPLGLLPPDLIISSGGKSVFTAHALASFYKTPYVFIGERKPYPSNWFSAVFSPVAAEVDINTYFLDLIPTPVTPEFIAEKGTLEPSTWCMVIGGKSRSYPFKDDDWKMLAHSMNALAKKNNIKWLLTTSRRTGRMAETILEKELNPDFIKDAIWWGTEPRRELYAFLARSELLFVTQDSITMVTEAVSSGKPVIAINIPSADLFDTGVQYSYFRRLVEKGYIVSIMLADLEKSLFSEKLFSAYSDNEFKVQIEKVFSTIW